MNVCSPLPAISLSLSLCLMLSTPVLAAAQQPVRFPERPARPLVAPQFTDREVAQLTATLDQMLAPGGSADVKASLWEFGRRLQAAYLTATQEAQVLRHLDGVARITPERDKWVADARRMVTDLTLGKKAPDIVGTDLDGAPLRLSDYRGKVVVLVFSAEWCGICRALNPYERFMLDLYENWPFAILGVDTGASRESVRLAKAQEKLGYPSFWDAPVPTAADEAGAIATAWNAAGFPTLYVLDGRGVIRFVDLRNEDLLKGVRQLVTAEVEIAQKASQKPRK